MTVLVTRPHKQGIALCQLLAQHGHHAIHHPLLNIVAGSDLHRLTAEIHQADIVIAVSQHAVHWVTQTLQNEQVAWPQSTIYVAIGQKTAQLLSKACQHTVHYPELSDSEHLLTLPVLQSIAGKRVVIWRGNGGRELIYQTLSLRGASVEYREMYQRIPLPFASDSALIDWQTQQVDNVIITSAEQLAFFCSQLSPQARDWTSQQRLIVPSQRIADQASQLGFHHIVQAGSAANQDLLAAVQS